MKNTISELQALIDIFLAGKKDIRILEAGCGSMSRLKIPADITIVGIDISKIQLERNPFIKEKILGDIQTYDLPCASYDIIICWHVLEHVCRPRQVMNNFLKSVKNGGLIVIAVPNVMSLKGLLTKYTPFGFHVWIYRHIFGSKSAGTNDNAPFPTVLRFFLSAGSIKKFAAQNGLSVEFLKFYEAEEQKALRKKFGLKGILWGISKYMIKILTLGRICAEDTDCVFVLKKRIK